MELRGQKLNIGLDIGKVTRWGSLIGGAALLFLGARAGLPRRTSLLRREKGWLPGWLIALAGADGVYYGLRGEGHLYNLVGLGHTKAEGGGQTSVAYRSSVRVDEAVTINKPVEELYAFWRNFDNLPRIMRHLESVRVIDNKRSHWVVKAPAGMKAEWDAEIVNEVPNELIGWRSLGQPGVDNAGSVHFTQVPGDHGTIVRVTLRYDAPGGDIATVLARLMGKEPGWQVQEDLRRFKAIIEAGEAPTTEGQPSGRVNLTRPEPIPIERRRPDLRAA